MMKRIYIMMEIINHHCQTHLHLVALPDGQHALGAAAVHYQVHVLSQQRQAIERVNVLPV